MSTSLRQRLGAIIAEVEHSELSAEEAKALLDGARALAAVVTRHRAFGRSLFRLLQTDDELRLVTDLLGDDDMLALCLVATPMRDIVYVRLRLPNRNRRRLNMSRAACTLSLARLQWSVDCGYDVLTGFSKHPAPESSSKLLLGATWPKKTPGELTIDAIAAHGNTEALLWAISRGCRWGANACKIAVSSPITSHLVRNMVGYLREGGAPWGAGVAAAVATRGDVDMLREFRETGCPWDATVVDAAVEAGHWSVLRYLRGNGCAVDDKACQAAAGRGDLEMLQFLREGQWAPWRTERRGDNFSHVLGAAVKDGHLDLIAWAVSDGCPMEGGHCGLLQQSAEHGQVDIMRWAVAQGCSWEGDGPFESVASSKWSCLISAVQHGHVAVVRYMLDEQGLQPQDEMATDSGLLTNQAAQNGHLEALQLLIERGFEWLPELSEQCASIDGLRHAGAAKEQRIREVIAWIKEQTAAEVAERERREAELWALQRKESFLEVVGAISAHNEQRDAGLRRLATCARPCVLVANPPDSPDAVHAEVRVMKESLASHLTPEALGDVAYLLHRRLDPYGEHNVDYAVVGTDGHWSRGWLDTLADRCETLVALAMQGEHTRADAVLQPKTRERAHALTTGPAVMKHIGETAIKHLYEHWRSAGFDGLQELLRREMDRFGKQQALKEVLASVGL